MGRSPSPIENRGYRTMRSFLGRSFRRSVTRLESEKRVIVYQELGMDIQGWREQSAGACKGRSCSQDQGGGWVRSWGFRWKPLYVMTRVHTISAVAGEVPKDLKGD